MNHLRSLVPFLLATPGFIMPSSAFGQEEHKNEIVQGILSSFDLPLKDLLTNEPEKNRVLQGLSLGAGFSMPLSTGAPPANAGQGTQGQQTSSSPYATLSVKYSPLTYWFAQTTFYKYTSPQLQAPWNPDFTYSFGYDDYHPYTFSLVYANYGGNRLFPDPARHQVHSSFAQGGWTLGWKFKLPKAFEDELKLFSSSAVGWSTHYTLVPTFQNAATSSFQHWKQIASVSVQYNVYKFWYWNISFLYYPISGQQQPWDPDFTYGFGYFDYHPGKISVQYNNYSGNRLPWRPTSAASGTFRKGGVSVSYTWSW